ncbi:MAG: hypothetical protein AAGG72_05200, partial [Pseudomonadota bacterium]
MHAEDAQLQRHSGSCTAGYVVFAPTLTEPFAPRIATGRARAAGLSAAKVGVVALSAFALSGCGLSSITSGLSNSVFGGGNNSSAQVSAVTEAQLLSAAKADVAPSSGPARVGSIVSAGCPKLSAPSPDNNLTIYEEGRVGDGLAIRHRGEITKTARECFIEPGRVTVKYGFSGRVLLGPRGLPGTLSFPVNVAVADAGRAPVASDKLAVNVDVAPDRPIGYFSAVRSITFDVAEGSRP